MWLISKSIEWSIVESSRERNCNDPRKKTKRDNEVQRIVFSFEICWCELDEILVDFVQAKHSNNEQTWKQQQQHCLALSSDPISNRFDSSTR